VQLYGYKPPLQFYAYKRESEYKEKESLKREFKKGEFRIGLLDRAVARVFRQGGEV
jgi:hypothetical protein